MGFLFGKPKIEDYELQKCLAYLEKEWEIRAFQGKEVDLYNKALVEYSKEISTDSTAAKEVYRAAKRLVQSAREILKRRGKVTSIPDTASAMYSAWQLAYSDYSAWTETQPGVVEAVANGLEPNSEHVQKLLLQTEKSRREAEKEEEKLLKRLKLSGDEAKKLFRKALDIVVAEDWQP